MSHSYFKRLLWVPVVAASLGTTGLYAAEALSPAPVVKHTSGEGKSVQALLLQLKDDLSGTVAHDHFIFIDTSASQVGDHRLHALAVLNGLLQSLPETDRVRLFAVDVEAESLMPSSASAQSDAVHSAVEALKERIPLGATNLQSAIKTALKANDATKTSSIVYIGDGMSTAGLLETTEVKSMVADLRDKKIPFHSYGVGPNINLQVLGVLALQTGGYVDFDQRNEIGNRSIEQGSILAQAVQRPVVFPKKVEVSGRTLMALPLRSDRETIHIVRGEMPADATVSFDAGDAGTFTCQLAAAELTSDSAFLGSVASHTDKDDDLLSNPFAGIRLMHAYQKKFASILDESLQSAVKKLVNGQTDQALQIAREVARLDPNNVDARGLTVASQKLQVRSVSQTAPVSDLENRIQPDPDASLIREQEHAIRVRTEKLRNQVSEAIKSARVVDPVSGLAILKQVLNTVNSSIDVGKDDRYQLSRRLDGEINQLRNQADKLAQDRVQLAERLAQLESQKLIDDQKEIDELKLDGLIERIRGLMLEGRHGHDEAFGEAQNVADVAINIRPGEGTSSVARFGAEAAQQLVRAYRLRNRRADQLLETLHQVEIAHIPFPDEPPVRFPPAVVWAALTERRQKWKDIDLRTESPRERRIQSELSQMSEVQFTDIPLRDAIDFLKAQHRIEIQFDNKALSEEGVSTDQGVSLVLSNVTLRSVLRLLLEPISLTYVIEDEVMKITTSTEAQKKLTTRVYPVADLVIMPMAGGGMGGMMGGMGGGMGGGMMGGMGGGMGGMGGGMGGMGGGMFSVPPEPIEAKPVQNKPAPAVNNNTIQSLKKKHDR